MEASSCLVSPTMSTDRAPSSVPPHYTDPSRTRGLRPTETILVSHNGRTKLLRRTSLQPDHSQDVKTSSYAIIITARDLHCPECRVTTLLHNIIIQRTNTGACTRAVIKYSARCCVPICERHIDIDCLSIAIAIAVIRTIYY